VLAILPTAGPSNGNSWTIGEDDGNRESMTLEAIKGALIDSTDQSAAFVARHCDHFIGHD